MLESGEFVTIAELAEREGIAKPYLTRILRLTLLAPEIVDGILNGTASHVSLISAIETFPISWPEQSQHFR